ncbi:NADH ubiquinone oxidoreductase 42 kDa subunit [Echinococcus multilocularis]|uniref:NADH ubiquinone oxidoreductase 42 kDa subunit n=1 Tax=Echinococcus multilocularis TaxID=6211 RepID=A0A068Y1X2_ECHMU|nr:NADH ubiquinone oxidoreductase 42 kDa subunit [Echinococcus multilocularis]
MALSCFSPRKPLLLVRLPSLFTSHGLQLAARGDFEPKKPPPFDFLSTGYPQWLMFDRTKHRFTENTKFICVEGNIACGKGHVAKKIAECFGMDYRPDPTDDSIFTLKNYNPPVDVRMHNTMLPKGAQYFTTKMFWTEENLKENGKPMYLQYQYYLNRYWNYLIGLCTLFNTGKGVVTDRSHFSDLAFVEALLNCGYISEYAHDWFGYLHANTALNLWKPHLIVYIKTSTNQIREGIKKKGIAWQINARNLSDDFLCEYEKSLEMYLEKMSRYSEIFVIDRTNTDIYNEDDLLIIMEKLTDIDYEGERLIRDDYKFLEWRNGLFNERSATANRAKFSSAMMKFTTQFKKFHMPLDMTDGVYSFDAKELQYLIYKRDPRLKYRPGYDPSKDSMPRLLFDPWLETRNFRKDWPTYFLTFY